MTMSNSHDCSSNCKFGRDLENEHGGKLLRCMLCARWYHAFCVDIPDEDNNTRAWACNMCRELFLTNNIIRPELFTMDYDCEPMSSTNTPDERELLPQKLELSMCKTQPEFTANNTGPRPELDEQTDSIITVNSRTEAIPGRPQTTGPYENPSSLSSSPTMKSIITHCAEISRAPSFAAITGSSGPGEPSAALTLNPNRSAQRWMTGNDPSDYPTPSTDESWSEEPTDRPLVETRSVSSPKNRSLRQGHRTVDTGVNKLNLETSADGLHGYIKGILASLSDNNLCLELIPAPNHVYPSHLPMF